MNIRHRFRRYVLQRPADEGGDLGASAAETVTPTAAPAPIEAPAAPAAPASAALATGPASMLDAVSAALQPRDELGRFTFKDAAGNAVDAQGNLAPNGAAAAPGAAPAPVAAAPVEPPQPEDPLAMPDGLGQKAQERFQKLANTVKEQAAQLEQATGAVEYVQTQFKEHGVQQPQFEQAVQVIGMINRGDFQGAQRVLLEQLQQLSLLSGQPMTSIDPLADHPDLRQRVDGLLISEADALEIARHRQMGNMREQAQQRQQQQVQQQREQEQAQQAQQQAVDKGLQDIDTFCKRMQSSDLDYQAIEAQLLPVIPELIKDVPPTRWGAVIKLQYDTIKNTAGRVRQQTPSTGMALRPTGQASPSASPKSMHEAMWGASPRA